MRITKLLATGLLATICGTSGIAQESIKIGLFGGTGPFSNLGEGFQTGIKPALDSFNSSHSDFNIETVTVNVGSYDPTIGFNSIRKAIEVDNVVTMLGAGSSILIAARSYLEANQRVIFPAAESAALIVDNNYLQQIVPLLSDEVNAAADYFCETKSIKTIAVLALSGAFGDTAVDTVNERFSACGVEVVSVQRYSVPTTSFRPQLAAIKRSKPDAVYLATIGSSENTSVVVQARQIGIDSKLIGYLASPEGALFDVDAGEGFVYTGFAVTEDLPEDVAKGYRAIGPLVLYGYNFGKVATSVIESLINSGDEVTGTAIRTRLLELKRFETASGEFCFQENGHTQMPLAIWEVRDGKSAQLQVIPSRDCD